MRSMTGFGRGTGNDGKLAVTIPKAYADAPTAKNFPGTEIKSDVVDNAADLSGFSFMRRVPWQIVYEEDIYVGYRYYNTFNERLR